MPVPAWAMSLKDDSEETQKKRMEACAGLNVLFLCMPGLPGMSPSLRIKTEQLTKTGANIYGVFNSPEEKLYDVLMNQFKVFAGAIYADMTSMDLSVSAANVKKAADESGIAWDAVFSPYENMMPLVGAVGERMGLPCNPEKAYTTARHKHNAREALRAAGIATPKSALMRRKEDADNVISTVGFPMIVKPLAGAGSQGVYIARDKETLVSTYAQLEGEVQANKFLAFNPGLGDLDVVCEQFLEGDECDCDFLISPDDESIVYNEICDDGPTTPPYFLESRENAPSLIAADRQVEIKKYAHSVLKAFGFNKGCFHVEVMSTKDGPRLIEVNPRMGGGPVPQFHQDVYGVDMYINFFMALCGIPINPPKPAKPLCSLVSMWIACPTTGILRSVDFMDQVKAHPNVIEGQPNFKVGDRVKGVDKSIPDVVGVFMMKMAADDLRKNCEEAERLKDSLVFDIEPEDQPVRRPSRRRSTLEPEAIEAIKQVNVN